MKFYIGARRKRGHNISGFVVPKTFCVDNVHRNVRSNQSCESTMIICYVSKRETQKWEQLRVITNTKGFEKDTLMNISFVVRLDGRNSRILFK